MGIREKVRNFSEKPLDKLPKVCYNKDVPRGTDKEKEIDSMIKLTKKVALEAAMYAVKNWELKEYTHSTDKENVKFSADEILAKLDEMWTALDRKSSTEKPMTEQQKQNVGYKSDILVVLSDGKTRTATELLNEVPSFEGTNMTNQRVSALLRQLILDGKVKKEPVKGKTMFSIVEGA